MPDVMARGWMLPGEGEPPPGIRVAMVSSDFGDNVVPLVRALSDAGCRVLFQTHDEQIKGRTHHLPEQVVLHRLPHPGLRQPVGQAKMLRAMRARSVAFGSDVVHLHQGQLWFNVSMCTGRNTPLVVTVHDPTPHVGDAPSRRTPRSLGTIPFARADRLIAHSEEVRDRLVDEHRVAPQRISVVPMMPPDPHAAAATPETAPELHPPTVLFLGRIWPDEGLEHLLAAEPVIAAAVPDVRIVVAGEGDWSHYAGLVTEPRRYELRLRHIPDTERDALFASADVVVFPYIDTSQRGVVLLAQQQGKAIVATSVGGLADQIEDGSTGLVVPPRDTAAFADAVVRVLTDETLRSRLAHGARARTQERTDPVAVAEQTLAVYRSAMAGDRGRS